MTIEVKYSCVLCGLSRVTLPMQAREGEPLDEWMQALTRQIQEDHLKRHPLCVAEKITEVLIPFTGTEKVGGPVLQ